MPSKPKAPVSPEPPRVIVDFIFDHGLLFVALINLDTQPVYRVSVSFSAPFKGLGGMSDISALRLFRRVEFLAPLKRIEAFIDTAEAYFRRKEPTRLEAAITYRDAGGTTRRHRVLHDLGIYRDLPYLPNPSQSTESALPRALHSRSTQ